jgi:hypothetical protein
MLGVKINIAAIDTAQDASEDAADETAAEITEAAQAYDDEAVINENEAAIQDGAKAEATAENVRTQHAAAAQADRAIRRPRG